MIVLQACNDKCPNRNREKHRCQRCNADKTKLFPKLDDTPVAGGKHLSFIIFLFYIIIMNFNRLIDIYGRIGKYLLLTVIIFFKKSLYPAVKGNNVVA